MRLRILIGGDMTEKILATVCWALLIGAAPGYAQGVHKLTAEIPYPFSVSGQQLPAGQYNFQLAEDHRTVTVRSADGKTGVQGMIVTVISASSGSSERPRVVFDNSGGRHILAEIWMPGHDGFLISGFINDSEHQHGTIKAAPLKK
jgi:hypothetical protein